MKKKPFWQTSEFWMSILAFILPMIFPERIDPLTAVGAAGAYAVSRGLTKHGTGDEKSR